MPDFSPTPRHRRRGRTALAVAGAAGVIAIAGLGIVLATLPGHGPLVAARPSAPLFHADRSRSPLAPVSAGDQAPPLGPRTGHPGAPPAPAPQETTSPSPGQDFTVPSGQDPAGQPGPSEPGGLDVLWQPGRFVPGRPGQGSAAPAGHGTAGHGTAGHGTAGHGTAGPQGRSGTGQGRYTAGHDGHRPGRVTSGGRPGDSAIRSAPPTTSARLGREPSHHDGARWAPAGPARPLASRPHRDATAPASHQEGGRQRGGAAGKAPVATASVRPGPPRTMADPCARFHDLRRDYCRQVLHRLMG